MPAETYNITKTFHTKVGTGWLSVEREIMLSVTATIKKYSDFDVSGEFNYLAQAIIDEWAGAHPSLTIALKKNTASFLEKWLCTHINTPRLEVIHATVNTIGPRVYQSLATRQPEPPHAHITSAITQKLDLTLHFRAFSKRIHDDYPELWEGGCTDGLRLDNALEQIKGQLIGRLDPVRTPIWKK